MILKHLIGMVLAAVSMAAPIVLLAQWREGVPEVITPSAGPAPEGADYIGSFRKSYTAAGSPRIVLFWNISFDDQMISTTEQQERVNVSTSYGSRSTTGAIQDEGDIVLRKSTRVIDSAKRSTTLKERDEAQLQTAFVQAMQSGGVQFLDRSAIMRSTQLGHKESDTDAKQVEARAVIDKADLLMEVMLVPDPSAPARHGFKVAVKNIKAGTEVFQLYTAANPRSVAQPKYYIAGEHGFERKESAAPIPTIADVGAQLANEVMLSLTGSL